MTTPIISVLIDTYNHGDFIEQAVESVLAQDFPAKQMEILVVDDGSTDDTPQRLLKYADRIRYLRKENGGQASAINVGIAHVKGEVVAFLDGDDVWLPNKVSRVIQEFQSNPRAVFVYHKFSFWDSRDGREWDPEWPLISGDVVADRHKLQIYSPSPAPTSSLAFRKASLDRLIPIPERCSYMHDAYLTGTGIFLGPVSAIPECLTKNRVHGHNLWYFEKARPDAAAWQRRVDARRAAIESMRTWMLANVPKSAMPQARKVLLLAKLAGEGDEFVLKPPGRLRFARHLLQRAWHYRARMTWRHRLVTYVNALGALFTGYRHLYLLDQWRLHIKRTLVGGSRSPAAKSEAIVANTAPSVTQRQS
jgi:glycosyltransferase involved in cell wall biosynthesis